MIRLLMRHVRRRRTNDDGMALVLVIGAMMVLMLLASSALAYAAGGRVSARHDQDWNAALAAAQAGVADYINHLNADDGYWKQVDCDNAAMLGPNVATACPSKDTSKVQFETVAGSANAKFHYDVDTTDFASRGVLTVTSTGLVNGVMRTLQVHVGRGGSTQFVYYTDHEQADPKNEMAYPGGVPNNKYCSGVLPNGDAFQPIYWWSSPPRNWSDDCQEIQFITGDVLDGEVHMNDTPLMSGSPEFTEGYETSDPDCKNATSATDYADCWRPPQGQSAASQSPIFDKPPMYAAPLKLQDNSTQFADDPGCQYSGQTRIRFTGDGYMLVWSKNSNATSACGGPGAPNGARVQVPNNEVIYVKGGGQVKQCGPGDIGDGLPLADDANMQEPDQYCGQGNLYVQGTVKGSVTLAASNDIVVTGDILLAGGPTGSDMVGLVAGNSIEIFNPVTKSCSGWGRHQTCMYSKISGWPQSTPWKDSNGVTHTGIRIFASIQTLQHSFYVQRYDTGRDQGDLYVLGSIAQRWRGIVGETHGGGWSSYVTGYTKSYHYDVRLKNISPPYFPQWVNAEWAVKNVGEVPPAYNMTQVSP